MTRTPDGATDPRPVVLIVDDRAENLLALEAVLEPLDLDLVRASSGEAALRRLLATDGDEVAVIILDVQMPGMDGHALASEIRKTLGRAMPRLILLSPLGHREPENADTFVSSLTKPVKASRLYDALVDVFSPASPPETHRGGGSTIPRLGDRHPLRILVAEDNLVNQKVAVSMLARLGYRADLVANGLEAIEAVRQVPYDLVLMDLQMPELDGLGATRQILGEHSAGRRPRIVALTANAFAEDRAECLAAGMDDYLSKPLQKDKLEEALTRASRIDAPFRTRSA
jgi:CheY-like chemotaxis protein